MEFLRRVIEQIKSQLKGLTTSQRLVLVLLVVIMCGAIYWMAQYSARRKMVPLLYQSLSEDARNRIIQKLENWGEQYRLDGDRIVVPKSRQRSLLAKLTYEEALPNDTSATWEMMLEDSGNIWLPESERENRKQIILQKELARTIAKFPGVHKTDVFINVGGKPSIGRIFPAASATVSVQTRTRPVNRRKLASAIAATVSGAVNRLKRENVTVTIDGELVPVAPEGQEFSSDYIEQLVAAEKYYRNKILDILPSGINALVQVDLKLQTTTTTKKSRMVAKDEEGSWNPVVETSGGDERSSDVQKQQEPGIEANASVPAQPPAGSTQEQTSEEKFEKRIPFEGFTETVQEIPPGGVSKEDITAVVSIPLLYFEDIARRKAATEEQPSLEEVETVKTQVIPGLKQMVMGAIGLAGTEYEDHVVVNSYWAGGTASDLPAMPGVPGGEGTGQADSSVAGIARQYGKHIAISALAMISLFMVLMMVRKASGPVDMTEDDAAAMMVGKKPADALGLEDINIVDGEDPDGLLAGIELDGKAVRSQQVLQQVRDMVKESPDTASNLISKWIKQSS